MMVCLCALARSVLLATDQERSCCRVQATEAFCLADSCRLAISLFAVTLSFTLADCVFVSILNFSSIVHRAGLQRRSRRRAPLVAGTHNGRACALCIHS
jgi:hypothetical protein